MELSEHNKERQRLTDWGRTDRRTPMSSDLERESSANKASPYLCHRIPLPQHILTTLLADLYSHSVIILSRCHLGRCIGQLKTRQHELNSDVWTERSLFPSPPLPSTPLPNMPLTVVFRASSKVQMAAMKRGLPRLVFAPLNRPSLRPPDSELPSISSNSNAACRFPIKPDQNNISRTKRFSGATKVK